MIRFFLVYSYFSHRNITPFHHQHNSNIVLTSLTDCLLKVEKKCIHSSHYEVLHVFLYTYFIINPTPHRVNSAYQQFIVFIPSGFSLPFQHLPIQFRRIKCYGASLHHIIQVPNQLNLICTPEMNQIDT